MDCHFNELRIDHRHVKYQSKANTSLYLGFDSEGNAICGRSSSEPSSSSSSWSPADETANNTPGRSTTPTTGPNGTPHRRLDQADHNHHHDHLQDGAFDYDERCYLFTKSNRLVADTSDFAAELKGKLSPNDDQEEPLTLPGRDANSTVLLAAYEAAKRRAAQPATVRQIEQRQLINMNRYRNILRWRLNRTASQSIALDETENVAPVPGAASSRPIAKGRRTGPKRQRTPKGKTSAKSRRQASTPTSCQPIDDEAAAQCEDDDEQTE